MEEITIGVVGVAVQIIRVLFPIAYLPALAHHDVFEEEFNNDQKVTLPVHHIGQEILNGLLTFFIPAALFHFWKLWRGWDSEASTTTIALSRADLRHQVADKTENEEENQDDEKPSFRQRVFLNINACISKVTETECVVNIANSIIDFGKTTSGKVILGIICFLIPVIISVGTTYFLRVSIPGAFALGILFAYEQNLEEVLEIGDFLLETSYLAAVLQSLEVEHKQVLNTQIVGYQGMTLIAEEAEEAVFLSILFFHCYGFTKLAYYPARSTNFRVLKHQRPNRIMSFTFLTLALGFDISVGALLVEGCSPLSPAVYASIVFRMIKDSFKSFMLLGEYDELHVPKRWSKLAGFLYFILFLLAALTTTFVYYVSDGNVDRDKFEAAVKGLNYSSLSDEEYEAIQELFHLCNPEEISSGTLFDESIVAEVYLVMSAFISVTTFGIKIVNGLSRKRDAEEAATGTTTLQVIADDQDV